MSTILGLDLGKFKSVACIYDPATTEAGFVAQARLDAQPLMHKPI
jgi:hypothetical protein